jgi:hypothetical protein
LWSKQEILPTLVSGVRFFAKMPITLPGSDSSETEVVASRRLEPVLAGEVNGLGRVAKHEKILKKWYA